MIPNWSADSWRVPSIAGIKEYRKEKVWLERKPPVVVPNTSTIEFRELEAKTHLKIEGHDVFAIRHIRGDAFSDEFDVFIIKRGDKNE